MLKNNFNKNFFVDGATIESVVPNDEKHYFFGYYDKSPRSKSGRFIIVHKTDFLDRLPNGKEPAEICIVDLQNNKKIQKLSETFAWNWQQGAMLQWLGPDFNENIIFNDLREGRFISVICNIETGQEKIVDFPVYAVHPSGEIVLSLNFSRLDYLREGYGYKGLEYQNKDEIAPKDDGIYLVDLKNGEKKLLLSFYDVCNFKNPIPKYAQGKHWIEHIMINPTGSRFAFIHRFQLKDNRFYSRLITADFNGTALNNLLDSGMASHADWKNNNEILIWGRLQSFASRVDKNNFFFKKQLLLLYHKLKLGKAFIKKNIIGDNLLLIKDNNIGNYEKIGVGVLNDDGHYSFSPNENWILGDSYPDKNHFRNLLIYNFKTGKKIDLGKFYSLPGEKFRKRNIDWNNWDLSALRCDLHPRWNRNETQICFDSVHDGPRKIYILNIEKIINA